MPPRKAQAESEFLWIEEGIPRAGCVAEVAPLLPIFQTYSFAVPSELEGSVALGSRVMAPMGRRGRGVVGFVVGLDRRVWDSTLRPIAAVVDEQSLLTPELVELGKRISRHYACPLGTTLKAMTPEAVRLRRGLKKIRYARPVRSLEDGRAERLSAKRLALMERLWDAESTGGKQTLPQPSPKAPGPLPDGRGSESGFKASETPLVDALRAAKVGAGVARWLAANGWIEIAERRVAVEDQGEEVTVAQVEPPFDLNEEQRAALRAIEDAIEARRFAVTLLFGVSGSGKTEVYVRAMRRALAAGKQAMLLVPEIVLTTQLVQRLAARFAQVAVVHSQLTEVQRARMWRRIGTGEKQVIIGTRSAVFAPCPNLGLICVDEEQETSFKNLQAPRFHVRDVAILRGQGLGIPVLLGSATPSLETWFNSAHRSEYQRVILRKRVNELPLPRVRLVDMSEAWMDRRQGTVLSPLMEEGLMETFNQKGQAVVLLNRRGFAPCLFCPGCKARVSCPNCGVNLVVHAPSHQLECHYCRFRQEMIAICPQVGCGHRLSLVGLGTQRVEDTLKKRFPKIRLQRVDSDTMRHRGEYERVVYAFSAREIDCLVGTQMIAKGLDFPYVSFVGVIDADPGALSSDFRAEERLFQLITQVAGRAGRAAMAGRVVVQTTQPDLPALGFALRHDYESFAKRELLLRQRVGWPPYRRLARLVFAHARDETAGREAARVAQFATEGIRTLRLAGADVIGPNPCPLHRLRRRYRQDLLLRTGGASDLHRLLHYLEVGGGLRGRAANLVVDVDPVTLQ